MVGIPINMPASCGDCPCNDDSYRCGATGEEFDFDQWIRRASNCPLIDITDDEK